MSDAVRKIAVIVALDVAGYSARTEVDEAKTTAEVSALRHVIEGIAKAHGGRVFNTAGDGFMLEFASSLAAVEAARDLAAKCEPKVRVGVHLGDVVVQPNGDLLGHGVNVAARLMARSDPGAALISADVRRTIRGPLAERLVSRGLMQLDKMTEAIEAFALAAAAAAMVAAPPKSAEPLLAVLPFDNLSNDPEMQFFSDGVSEEILHTIARAKGLKVIGKGSSFQFRGNDKSIRKVANELRATHVLDGSVRRSGAQIRVSAQLVEAASQTTLWSDRFDRELADVLKLQDEIAIAISDALKSNFIAQPATSQIEPAVYELYLRARPLIKEPGQVPVQEAAALLEQAVARAPHFARAWAQLAAARAFLLPYDRDAIGEPAHDAALAAANRALMLDPNCGEAFRALAMLEPAFSRHQEKLRLAEQGAKLSQSDADVANGAQMANLTVGYVRRSMSYSFRAIALEPLSPRYASQHARHLMYDEQTSAAMTAILDARRRFPDARIVVSALFEFLVLAGRLDEAEHLLDDIAVHATGLATHEIQELREVVRLWRAPLLERDQALRVFLSPQQNPAVPLIIVGYAAASGSVDLAYETMFSAFETGRPIAMAREKDTNIARAYLPFVLFGNYGKALRSDARFPRLCARFGLIDFWQSSGEWPDCATRVPYDFKAECEKAAAEVAKV